VHGRLTQETQKNNRKNMYIIWNHQQWHNLTNRWNDPWWIESPTV